MNQPTLETRKVNIKIGKEERTLICALIDFNNAKTQKDIRTMNFIRRCIRGYISDGKARDLIDLVPDEVMNRR